MTEVGALLFLRTGDHSCNDQMSQVIKFVAIQSGVEWGCLIEILINLMGAEFTGKKEKEK